MIEFICIMLLMFFTSSCKEKQQEAKLCLVKDSICSIYNSNKLSDIVEHFELIPLETTDESLLGNIDIIKKRNGRYYVQSNRDKLSVFDSNGKHLFNVGQVGQGPGEYSLISDFDADLDNIYILSPKNIFVYDLSGHFIKKISIEDCSFGKIRHIRDGFLLYSINPFSNGTGLAFIDNNANFIKTAMPLNEATSLTGRIAWNQWDSNNYIYHLTTSNDLYVFNLDGKEFYPISLMEGDDTYTSKEIDRYIDYEDTTKKMILAITSTKIQVLWGTTEMGGHEFKYYIYDKLQNKVSYFSLNEIIDDLTFCKDNAHNGMLGLLSTNDSDDNYFISYVLANDLKENILSKNITLQEYKKLQSLDEDSNPVIVSLKFK